MGAARALLLLVGLFTTAGATYFTIFASPEQGGVTQPVDWFLGGWAMTMGIGLLFAVARLGQSASLRAVRLTAALVGAHIVFSVIKLIGYGESEVVTVLAVDFVILGLLAASRRP